MPLCCYIHIMKRKTNDKKKLFGIASAVACMALAVFAGSYAIPRASALTTDPSPHAPLPAYKYNYPKPTITLSTTDGAADLAPWLNKTVLPLLKDWYPVLADTVIGGRRTCYPEQPPASCTYPYTSKFTIKSVSTYQGVAATTSGNVIIFNPNWVRSNQATTPGVFIHEMTHVVQQGHSSPSWFTEGLADYIRVYVYQDMNRPADANATYLNGYTDSAHFLKYIKTQSPNYLRDMAFATYRTGVYTPSYTTKLTGKSLETHWKNYSGKAITTMLNMKPGNATTRCIDLPNFATATGTRPDIWDCVAQDNERWVATSQDTAEGGMIQGVYGAKCLRVNKALVTAGGYGVDYAGCDGSAIQKFLRRTNSTVYNAATNRCLRPLLAGTVNGTKLEVVGCNIAQTAQKWTWSAALQ